MEDMSQSVAVLRNQFDPAALPAVYNEWSMQVIDMMLERLNPEERIDCLQIFIKHFIEPNSQEQDFINNSNFDQRLDSLHKVQKH